MCVLYRQHKSIIPLGYKLFMPCLVVFQLVTETFCANAEKRVAKDWWGDCAQHCSLRRVRLFKNKVAGGVWNLAKCGDKVAKLTTLVVFLVKQLAHCPNKCQQVRSLQLLAKAKTFECSNYQVHILLCRHNKRQEYKGIFWKCSPYYAVEEGNFNTPYT